MPLAGEKEGADVNGDGVCTLADAAILSAQWMQNGDLPGDLDPNGRVDLDDLARWTEFWTWKGDMADRHRISVNPDFNHRSSAAAKGYSAATVP